MPLPIIIPIAAAAAAGTVGFLIGREMASTSEDDYEEVLTAIPASESGNGQARVWRGGERRMSDRSA